MRLSQGLRLYGASETTQEQRIAFTSGSVPVAVYGLGKMGLPLAGVYAEKTGNVIGVDVDPAVVDTINSGRCPVDREPGLPELVAEQVSRGALRAVVDSEAAASAATVHVVIVPTPITADNHPDLDILLDVVRDIGSGLDSGDMVVIECTVPPGTCQDLVVPRLAAESGLNPGEFGVAFCPERTSSGRALEDIRGAYPKIVGGVDDESTRIAELMYHQLTANEVYPVSDATTAESVKLFEGVYRDVNIALANELGRLTDELGIDVREAIETANTQPFCDLHMPGPGVGGHCIPYYPYFVMDQVTSPTPLIQTAREVNDSMPGFTVEKLVEELDDADVPIDQARVLVLGVTYRPGVRETRASPAIPIIERLRQLDAEVYAADPMLDDFSSYGAIGVEVDDVEAHEFDAAVIVTPHEEFDDIDWRGLGDIVVIDGRRSLPSDAVERLYTIGSGRPQRR